MINRVKCPAQLRGCDTAFTWIALSRLLYFPPPPGFLTTAMAAAVISVIPPKIGEIRSKGRLATAIAAITSVTIAFIGGCLK